MHVWSSGQQSKPSLRNSCTSAAMSASAFELSMLNSLKGMSSDKCTSQSLKSGEDTSFGRPLPRTCNGDPCPAYFSLKLWKLRCLVNAPDGILKSHFPFLISIFDRILPVSTLIAAQTKQMYAWMRSSFYIEEVYAKARLSTDDPTEGYFIRSCTATASQYTSHMMSSDGSSSKCTL